MSRMSDDWMVVRALAALQQVREIHRPHRCRMSTRHVECFIMHGGGCANEGKCRVCRVENCDTIRTLDLAIAALDPENEDERWR